MNDRWDDPLKISQNGPGKPTSSPAQTRKRAKTFFSLKIFFSRTETGRMKKIMVL
jgi:hypothetical protein